MGLLLRRSSPTAIALLGVLAAPAVASAGSLADAVSGPRAMAMGGAHVAVSNDNAAIFYNPAGISYFKKYSIELGYQHSFDLKSHLGNISIVDSKSSRVGGALSLSYLRSHPDSPEYGLLDRNGFDMHLAASYPLSDRIMFGVTNKLIIRNVDPKDVDDPKDGDAPPDDIKRYSLDVGVLFVISEGITLGVTGRNLTLPKHEELPTELAAGFGLGIGPVTFAADYVADFTTSSGVAHSAHAGAEVFLFKAVALRAGYTLLGVTPDDEGGYGIGHWITGGAAYINKSFAIDAGYKRKIAGVGTSSWDTFAVALRFFL